MTSAKMPEFLGQLVCPIQLGRRIWDKKRREYRTDPINKKRACWAYLSGRRKRKPRGLTKEDWGDHLMGTETFYFVASPYGTHVLIMIDIDCKGGVGSYAGSLAFIKFICTLPGFGATWYERSTGGIGIHAYIIVEREGIQAAIVNKGIRHLERWLKRLFAENREKFDISGVEVKGTCPVFVKMRNGSSSYTFGQFGKFPRDLMSDSRCKAFTETTRLTVPQMIALDRDSRKESREKRRSAPLASVSKGGDEGGPATLPIRPAKELPARGSTDAPFLRPELLGAISGTFLDTAHTITPDNFRTRDGKRVITAHHVAVTLAILRHCQEHPNKDGSLPQARAQSLWTRLHESGYSESPWDHDRWVRIRDRVDTLGGIEWVSRDYLVGRTYGATYVKGKATRWEATGFVLSIPEEHWSPSAVPAGSQSGNTPSDRGGSLGAVQGGVFRLPDGTRVQVERPWARRPVFAGFIDDWGRKAG
jgi:hypothetical protein